MTLSKFKRVLSAVIAAVLCISAILGVPASAAKKSVWQETKELAGAKYYSKYITWVEKYSEKDTKNTVTYSKSRTKKFLDKFKKASEKDNPQFSYSVINKDYIMYTAIKGSNFKAVGYTETLAAAYIGNSKKITFFDMHDKEKYSVPIKETDFSIPDAETFAESAAEAFYTIFNFDIKDDYIGTVFKFKSGDKTYYYEKFDDDLGFLFSESGNVLAGNIGGNIYCINISYKVDSSVFDIPSGYKSVDIKDIDWL